LRHVLGATEKGSQGHRAWAHDQTADYLITPMRATRRSVTSCRSGGGPARMPARTHRQVLHRARTRCAPLFDATTCASDVCRHGGVALRERTQSLGLEHHESIMERVLPPAHTS
jgi:hypothetical protein